MNRLKHLFFYDDEPAGGGTPIEQAVDLAHENRITKLEERETQNAVELQRQLNDLRQELMQAIEARDPDERIAALATRLETVEGKLEDSVAEPVNEVEDTGPGLSFEAQEMEESPAPPEKKERKGNRARRKARRNGGS